MIRFWIYFEVSRIFWVISCGIRKRSVKGDFNYFVFNNLEEGVVIYWDGGN